MTIDEQLKELHGGRTTRYYAGIGSRETPEDVGAVMKSIADSLGKKGYILRSGGANGADTFFERGACVSEHTADIWLPWPRFNGRTSKLFPTEKHFTVGEKIHPVWERLVPAVRKLVARNMAQVLGVDFDVEHVLACIDKKETPHPQDSWSSFVLCWTKDKAQSHLQVTSRTGGTGTAIKLASILGIPVFNLANESAKARLEQWVE